MANVRQKDPALLVNKRGGRGRVLTVVSRAPDFQPPAPPDDIEKPGQRAWASFWKSEVSTAVDVDADLTELEHWARCVDERARLWPLVKKSPLVPGPSGALIINPLAKRIRELTLDIDRISDRFGMSPMSRFKLQLTVSEAGKSATELLKMLEAGPALPAVVELDIIEGEVV